MTSSAHHIAYLINAYKQPELLRRLVDRLSSNRARFLIHVDRKSKGFDGLLADLAARPDVTILPRIPIYWGGPQLLDVFLLGLRVATAGGVETGHVVYLTGQDYPLATTDQIETFLVDNADSSFMDTLPLGTDNWTEGGWPRIRGFHYSGRLGQFSWPGTPPRRLRRVERLWAVAGRYAKPRATPEGISPHGGSGVWALSYEAARYVLAFCAERPDVLRFYRWTYAPDEMFLHSVMMSGPLAGAVVDSDLHHTRWEPMSAHPVVFTASELPELMASSELFVRKVDLAVSAELLDLLDRA